MSFSLLTEKYIFEEPVALVRVLSLYALLLFLLEYKFSSLLLFFFISAVAVTEPTTTSGWCT